MNIKIDFPKITEDSWKEDMEYHMEMANIETKRLTREQWKKKKAIKKLKENW